MGTGTLDEAQAWVEYCNGTGNTYWANLRRKNGHEEPYGVKYWGLGNERYGNWQIGALNAEYYTKRAIAFAKDMKSNDPTSHLATPCNTARNPTHPSPPLTPHQHLHSHP